MLQSPRQNIQSQQIVCVRSIADSVIGLFVVISDVLELPSEDLLPRVSTAYPTVHHTSLYLQSSTPTAVSPTLFLFRFSLIPFAGLLGPGFRAIHLCRVSRAQASASRMTRPSNPCDRPSLFPVLFHKPGIFKLEVRSRYQIAVSVSPFPPVYFSTRFRDEVDGLRQTVRRVIKRLAFAAVLAQLPSIPLAVAVLMFWCISALVHSSFDHAESRGKKDQLDKGKKGKWQVQ